MFQSITPSIFFGLTLQLETTKFTVENARFASEGDDVILERSRQQCDETFKKTWISLSDNGNDCAVKDKDGTRPLRDYLCDTLKSAASDLRGQAKSSSYPPKLPPFVDPSLQEFSHGRPVHIVMEEIAGKIDADRRIIEQILNGKNPPLPPPSPPKFRIPIRPAPRRLGFVKELGAARQKASSASGDVGLALLSPAMQQYWARVARETRLFSAFVVSRIDCTLRAAGKNFDAKNAWFEVKGKKTVHFVLHVPLLLKHAAEASEHRAMADIMFVCSAKRKSVQRNRVKSMARSLAPYINDICWALKPTPLPPLPPSYRLGKWVAMAATMVVASALAVLAFRNEFFDAEQVNRPPDESGSTVGRVEPETEKIPVKKNEQANIQQRQERVSAIRTEIDKAMGAIEDGDLRDFQTAKESLKDLTIDESVLGEQGRRLAGERNKLLDEINNAIHNAEVLSKIRATINAIADGLPGSIQNSEDLQKAEAAAGDFKQLQNNIETGKWSRVPEDLRKTKVSEISDTFGDILSARLEAERRKGIAKIEEGRSLEDAMKDIDDLEAQAPVLGNMFPDLFKSCINSIKGHWRQAQDEKQRQERLSAIQAEIDKAMGAIEDGDLRDFQTAKERLNDLTVDESVLGERGRRLASERDKLLDEVDNAIRNAEALNKFNEAIEGIANALPGSIQNSEDLQKAEAAAVEFNDIETGKWSRVPEDLRRTKVSEISDTFGDILSARLDAEREKSIANIEEARSLKDAMSGIDTLKDECPVLTGMFPELVHLRRDKIKNVWKARNEERHREMLRAIQAEIETATAEIEQGKLQKAEKRLKDLTVDKSVLGEQGRRLASERDKLLGKADRKQLQTLSTLSPLVSPQHRRTYIRKVMEIWETPLPNGEKWGIVQDSLESIIKRAHKEVFRMLPGQQAHVRVEFLKLLLDINRITAPATGLLSDDRLQNITKTLFSDMYYTPQFHNELWENKRVIEEAKDKVPWLWSEIEKQKEKFDE